MDKFAGCFAYKRRVTQLFTAVLFNLNLRGFFEGKIYQGSVKGICTPGLNCYSCPGAVLACPLGSFQVALGELRFGKLPLYTAGTMIVFGILFGRAVCGFACPFGLIQEFLYKLPGAKLGKGVLTRRLSFLKYVVLTVFVFALPLYYVFSQGIAVPAFCKFICPAGTLEAGVPLVLLNSGLRQTIGFLFDWKAVVLAVIVASAIFMYRSFCRMLCPLGAIYSFFNRHAVFGVDVEESICVNCARCIEFCKMDVSRVNDRECIRCGECAGVCPVNAIVSRTPTGLKKLN